MGSPTQGMWTCAHGIDGRDWCEKCHQPAESKESEMDWQYEAKAPVLAKVPFCVVDECPELAYKQVSWKQTINTPDGESIKIWIYAFVCSKHHSELDRIAHKMEEAT